MKRILPALGLVALGIALGLLGQRLFFPTRGTGAEALAGSSTRESLYQRQLALAEERCRENAELTLVQVLRLAEFGRFAELGQDVSLVLVASSASAVERGTKLPRLLLDPATREEWSDLGKSLAGLAGGVDSRVFELFQAVRDFAARHPWPEGGNLGAISRSDWSRADVVEEWLTLNKSLRSRVIGVMGQFYSQS